MKPTIMRILDNLNSKDKSSRLCPRTELYNEGWLLRHFMQIAKENPESHFSNKKVELVLSHPKEAIFRFEGRLHTQFEKKPCGDNNWEQRTVADGVIGDFHIERGTKTGISLNYNARNFSVLEAKINAPLSKGIKNSKKYDQAARTVACIASTIYEAKLKPSKFKRLEFGVIAVKKKIRQGNFEKLLDPKSIKEKVRTRVEDCDGNLKNWYDKWFKPTLKHIQIEQISWEELIKCVSELDSKSGKDTRFFYDKCLECNSKRK